VPWQTENGACHQPKVQIGTKIFAHASNSHAVARLVDDPRYAAARQPEKRCQEAMNHVAPASTAIFILGTGRDGASAMADVLSHAGIDLGPDLPPRRPRDLKKSFEHAGIVRLHADLLSRFDSTRDDPSSLPKRWEQDPRIEPLRDQLASIIRRDFAGRPLWGVKEPSLCRLLPFWLPVLRELGVAANAMFIVRDPADASASFRPRDGMAPDQAPTLWLSRVLASERGSRHMPRTVILYEDLVRDWEVELRRVGDALGLDFSAFPRGTAAEIADLFDAIRRGHRDMTGPPANAPQNMTATNVYEAMVRWRREGISPAPVCDSAAETLAQVERAAEPIAAHLRARTNATLAAVEAMSRRTLVAERRAREAEQRARDAEAARDKEAGLRSAAERERDAAIRRAAESGRRTALARRDAAEAEARAARLELAALQIRQELARTTIERDAMLRSTSWKVTSPLRAAGTRLPQSVKRALHGARLASWSAPLRLPGKPNGPRG
jgi:hypothetical protein